MTIESTEEEGGQVPAAPAPEERGAHLDTLFPEPTAGMVLHRVLAVAARTFLLNDAGDRLEDTARQDGTAEGLDATLGTRPLWAQSAAGSLEGTERRSTPVERIHQSRVSMRRIRSNLRTFRLLLDPGWGTSLRAELAWYGKQLGRSRDLDILAAVITGTGNDVLDAEDVDRLLAVVETQRRVTFDQMAALRTGPRRSRLTEQIMVLWEGPEFKPKAKRPATDVLPLMLQRARRDLRGTARTARKVPSEANLHAVRIRLKDLRYGCETVALVEGDPAQKTARAAERLQSKLGDLHDAVYSLDWLATLAHARGDLAAPIDELVLAQRARADEARRGWKRELKEVDRRWRRWQNG